MKTRNLFITLSSFALAIGASSFALIKNNDRSDFKVVSAVDINDYSACEIAHKNHNVTGLLSALRTITSEGKSGSYDGLYETYKVAYLKDNGKIFDYYSAFTNYDPDKDRAGSYKKEGDCFNREHSIPQSWWGGGTSNQGSDPFIVVPTDGYVNNARSSDPFGMVADAKKTFSNSKSGTADASWGYSGTVFEPDDSVKGDFARIYFYAIAKYKAASGWSGNNARSCFSGSDNTNTGLTPYAVKLFSYWSNLDPVSDWEMHANNAIAPIQGNRNPFIDHPEYANTLWGDVSGYTQYTHGSPSAGGVNISKTSAFLISGNTTKISATSSDSSTITWTTSNSSVVSLSSSSSSSGSEITLTAGSEGSATITAKATIDDEIYTKECEVEVSATKKVTSIEVQDPKTKYSVGDTFVKPTVIATYNDGSSANVSDSAEYAGYDLSVAGAQTVTVTYSFGGASKQADYQITVKSSGGSGEIITAEIDFTGNKTSDDDANGYTWSAVGSFTSGSSYLRLNSSDTYISNSPAISMDTSEDISFTATLRTYGGAKQQSLVIGAYDIYGTLISETLTLTPNNNELNDYSGTFSFNTSGNYDVVIKAYSGNNSSLGISGMSVTYKESSSSSKELESIGVSTSPNKLTYEVGECFNPSGLVISRDYSDETSDTYTYSGHTSEFTFIPSLVTPLTAIDDSVEIIYGGESCFIEIEITVPVELISIEISDYQTEFVEGDQFVFGGTVTALYADQSEADVTSLASISEVDTSVVGSHQVTVSYKDKQQNYSVTVVKGTLSSIAVSDMTVVYVKNGAFSFDGTCTATFANGYQIVVTPTSVTSPNMSTAGIKQVTVTYSYNGITKSTSYNITVNSYRVVMETSEVEGQITWPTSGNASVSGVTATVTNVENTYYESGNKALRLGTGSGGGKIKIEASNIVSIQVKAKAYNSYSGALSIGSSSINVNASSYTDYDAVEFANPVNELYIYTSSKQTRICIKQINIVCLGTEVDIGKTEDCLGLEAFITSYMHMDYTENLGYCSDSEHNYYATAKAAFNDLNDHQRSLFTGNNAYLAEWTRLSTWASKNGDSLSSSNNKLITTSIVDSIESFELNSTLITIIAVSALSTCVLLSFLIIKKRRWHK